MTADNKQVFGVLATESVELPPETPEEAKRLEEQNKEIAHLGFRTFRGGTDYSYREYRHMCTNMSMSDAQRFRKQRAPRTLFQSGDLVRVFKTVSDGDVAWQGKISFDRKQYHHGYQRSIPHAKWEHMFKSGMTCKVERPQGQVLYGALDAWAVSSRKDSYMWILREFGKSAQADGIHTLADGDRMTVYSAVRDGEVEWEGRLNFNVVAKGRIGAVDVVRTAKHMNPRMWLQLCHEKRPVIVMPKA